MNKIYLTKPLLCKHILGTIYELAPGCKVRNINKIHKYILNWCNENKINYTDIEYSKFEDYLRDMLMNCLEFRQLNISQKLWDTGVRDYDDERNQGFAISTFVSHDKNGDPSYIYTAEEYTDFIDLDACIPNIVSSYINEIQINDDCFLCKFAGKYGNMEPTNCEECKTCLCNPKIKYNRVPHPKSLLPRNSEEYKNYKED